MAAALCRQVDPEIFYPSGADERSVYFEQRSAQEICGRCPVIDPCLALGLELSNGYGIWGGKTVEERATIKRKRRNHAND